MGVSLLGSVLISRRWLTIGSFFLVQFFFLDWLRLLVLELDDVFDDGLNRLRRRTHRLTDPNPNDACDETEDSGDSGLAQSPLAIRPFLCAGVLFLLIQTFLVFGVHVELTRFPKSNSGDPAKK